MIIIGLTGGIASGKSFIASRLAKKQFCVFDADKEIHTLLDSNEHAIESISVLFPTVVKEGKIDRELLGDIVFQDVTLLKQLEDILYPLLREKREAFLLKSRYSRCRFVVLDIPLLFENHMEKLCDITITTNVPFFIQQERALRRKTMNPEKFLAIYSKQMSSHWRNIKANYVVHTGLSKGYTVRQLNRILRELGCL